MKPRLLFRTHYQVDEPAYMELLIKRCTSPVRSSYREVVAERLAADIRAREKKFNAAAGAYAVDLARSLGILSDQHVWTERGHAVDLIATVADGDLERELELTPPERLLHFWLFLEADGAALIYLSRRLMEEKRLGDSEAGWNTVAQEMFLSIFSDYLTITRDTRERVKLRSDIDRLRSRGYEGKTGAHKVFVHLQTLYRLGLVRTQKVAASRVYEYDAHDDRPVGLRALVSSVPDIGTLEAIVKDRGWISVAARVFGWSKRTEGSDAVSDDDIGRVFASYYRKVADTGVPLAPLTTLISAVQISFICQEPSRVVGYLDALGAVERLQKGAPKDVRFHVDRRGRPAFIKLSDPLSEELAGGG